MLENLVLGILYWSFYILINFAVYIIIIGIVIVMFNMATIVPVTIYKTIQEERKAHHGHRIKKIS